jgi:uncharacterized protein YdiU (UPF0061 family)
VREYGVSPAPFSCIAQRSPFLFSTSPKLIARPSPSCPDFNSDYFTQIFSGNQLVEGMQPYAMCYGGHQFGNWAGQLGDGRAIRQVSPG